MGVSFQQSLTSLQGRLEDGSACQERSRYWCCGHLDEGELFLAGRITEGFNEAVVVDLGFENWEGFGQVKTRVAFRQEESVGVCQGRIVRVFLLLLIFFHLTRFIIYLQCAYSCSQGALI